MDLILYREQFIDHNWIIFWIIFMRGNFSSYICLSLKKRFVCPLNLNADIQKMILVQSGDFCIPDYKIRFCKEVYISPYPKIVIFKNHVQQEK